MFHIDSASISDALSDISKVFRDNDKNSRQPFAFESFTATNHPHILAAIDGSNHNIRGTHFVFSTLRTGYLLYEKGVQIAAEIDPIRVEFIMNNEEPNVGFGYKHESYYHRITGEIPTGRLEYEKVSERLRTLLEWEKVAILLEKLNRGDLIIFDGSLISGEISTSHHFFNSLKAKALEKGICLIGLSKDTSLSIDSASVPVVLLEASRHQHPNRNWFVQLDDSYFVKFSKMKDLVFRVDPVLPDGISFSQAISWVGSYCFDRMLFGYPFPMQKIHDEVRISEAERDYAFGLFKQACLQSGIHPAKFDQMFRIYHDELDLKSYGR